MKTKKMIKLLSSYLRSFIIPTPVLIHLYPTNRCNLNCSYCYIVDNKSPKMSKDEIDKIIDKSLSLKSAIFAFMGGEPLIWSHIYYTIKKCTSKNITTFLTTNGVLLNKNNVDKLINSKLDILEVSVDAVSDKDFTKKTLSNNKHLISNMLYAKENNILVKFNTVLTKKNIKDVSKLLELSNQIKIPITIGLIVKPFNDKNKNWRGDKDDLVFESKQDLIELKKIIDKIIDKKKKGYPIIDPISYFEDVFKYLKREKIWECTRRRVEVFGVNPTGHIYWCGKMNSISNMKLIEMNKEKMKYYLEKFNKIAEKCVVDCYSNCAYNTWYFRKHPFIYFKNILLIYIKTRKNVRILEGNKCTG